MSFVDSKDLPLFRKFVELAYRVQLPNKPPPPNPPEDLEHLRMKLQEIISEIYVPDKSAASIPTTMPPPNTPASSIESPAPATPSAHPAQRWDLADCDHDAELHRHGQQACRVSDRVTQIAATIIFGVVLAYILGK
jgi:hypothetical protein